VTSRGSRAINWSELRRSYSTSDASTSCHGPRATSDSGASQEQSAVSTAASLAPALAAAKASASGARSVASTVPPASAAATAGSPRPQPSSTTDVPVQSCIDTW
jgi:hypothetical protein